MNGRYSTNEAQALRHGQRGFLDPKWRSSARWEHCTAVRLKASSIIPDLLACGCGGTPDIATFPSTNMRRT